MEDSKPHPLSPHEWPSALANILDDLNGRPVNVHRLMANNPELMQAWWSFRNYAVKGGSLGQRKAEISILRVSAHMNSWYEWGSHADRAIFTGIEVAEILALLEPVTSHPWSEEERALIMAVDDLMKYRKVRPVTLAIMNKNYSNKQIMDLIAVHGMYHLLASMIKTWGLSLDEEILERISSFTDEDSFMAKAQVFAVV